jgi:Polysaccharide lyase
MRTVGWAACGAALVFGLVVTGACGGGDGAAAPGVDGGPGVGSSGSSGSRGGGPDGSPSGDAGSDSGPRGDAGGDGAVGGRDAGQPNAARACPAVAPGDHETYGLPPTTNLPAGISAMTDWAAHPATGGWSGRQVMDDCRYRADPDGFVTWHGKTAARVEVNAGDDPLALGAGSERAEMLTLQSAAGVEVKEGSGTAYYATSYFFPTTWDGTFLHGDSNSWSFVLQMYPLGGLSAGRHDTGSPQIYDFASLTFSDGGTIALGKWTDFVFMIDWTAGHIVWWRRDQGQAAFTKVVDGIDATFKNATSAYVKQGLYRGGDVNGRTDVFWIGPTARGDTFAAVEGASFGTSAGPP